MNMSLYFIFDSHWSVHDVTYALFLLSFMIICIYNTIINDDIKDRFKIKVVNSQIELVHLCKLNKVQTNPGFDNVSVCSAL